MQNFFFTLAVFHHHIELLKNDEMCIYIIIIHKTVIIHFDFTNFTSVPLSKILFRRERKIPSQNVVMTCKKERNEIRTIFFSMDCTPFS
jgi:hypothetical protein